VIENILYYWNISCIPVSKLQKIFLGIDFRTEDGRWESQKKSNKERKILANGE
jgi:hypothetical protein